MMNLNITCCFDLWGKKGIELLQQRMVTCHLWNMTWDMGCFHKGKYRLNYGEKNMHFNGILTTEPY